MQPDPKRLLKLVQVGRRELGLDDEDYRALLESVTGARSAKGLKAAQLEAVVKAMKGIGFKVKVSAASGKRLSPASSAKVQAPEVRKIRAIWITMHNDGFVRDGSEDGLGSYIKRMTTNSNGGAGIQRLDWLTSAQAERVLEALKKWHIRLMTAVILARGDRVPDTRSHREEALPGYDLIRQAYENPGWRPAAVIVIDGSKPVGVSYQEQKNEQAP